jgi:hypothetical protein
MPAAHGQDYWLGSLAMTVALATRDPEPRPLLRTALADFLRERPPGDELGDLLRQTLKEKT